MVPAQVAKIQGAFWTPRPGLVEVLQALVLFTASLPLPSLWFVIALVFSLQILVMLVLELVKDKEGKGGIQFLGVTGLTLPVMLFIVSYLMRPVFVPRGFLVSAFLYAGLSGTVISHSWKRKTGMLVAGSFMAAALISLPYQMTFREFPRSPFAEAAVSVEAEMRPGDRLIHDNKLSAFPFLVYAPEMEQTFLADEPGSHNDTLALPSQQAMDLYPEVDIAAASEGADRIHFVVFSKAIEEYRLLEDGEHPNLSWLDGHYRFVRRAVFNDLEVYTFER
jgi:hypothetical protein